MIPRDSPDSPGPTDPNAPQGETPPTADPTPDPSASPAASPTADPTPTPVDNPLRFSRTSGAWVSVVPAVVLLVLLVIFIFQNTQSVQVSFLWFDGHPPLSAALLVAVAGGMALVALVGSLRILQLRRRVKREKKGRE